MTLTADAIQAIRDLGQLADSQLHEINGVPMAPVRLHDARPKVPEPTALVTTDLPALISYLDDNVDSLEAPMVHVESPDTVAVLSRLLPPLNQRLRYAAAQHRAGDSFNNERYMPVEDFIIGLSTHFADEEDRAAVLKLVGNLKDEAVRTHADDGVTQTVTARVGIAKVEAVEVPNPVTLVPSSMTFPDIACPEALFMLRVRKGAESPQVALFAVNRAEWESKAMEKLRDYLGNQLDTEVPIL